MKLREIERLRAVAILMVMAAHWRFVNALLPAIPHDPWSGVDLFFVISGYVVTLSLCRLLPPLDGAATLEAAFATSKHHLKVFWARRFFRIVPAALTAALLHGAVIVFLPSFGYLDHWKVEFIAFFGGVYNYVKPLLDYDELGVYWSLSVEEHFYLLLPPLFVMARTKSRRLAACAAIIAFVALVVRPMSHPIVPMANQDYYERFSSHLRFDTLMAGVALGLLSDSKPTPAVLPRWLLSFVLVPAAILLLACLPGAAPPYVMHRVGFVMLWIFSGFLVSLAGEDRGYVLAIPIVDRVLEYLGSRSYALYLVHADVQRLDLALRISWPEYSVLVPKDGAPSAVALRAALFLAVALTAAELLHRGVEKPFMRLGRRLTEGSLKRAAASVPAPAPVPTAPTSVVEPPGRDPERPEAAA
jgi:peptidoglycan/LPS O-acetylase OafA/YrhL